MRSHVFINSYSSVLLQRGAVEDVEIGSSSEESDGEKQYVPLKERKKQRVY